MYRTRERIHRSVADLRLLATPASRGRVADPDPNWGQVCGICSALRLCVPLSWPLLHLCSPGHKGHAGLTSSPPSSDSSPAVPAECPPLSGDSNSRQGLRSFWDLTRRLTARADDSHVAPVPAGRAHHPAHLTLSGRLELACQARVRFFALHRIKPNAPRLVRVPVNSFEFRPCGRTPQAGCLTR